MSLQIFEKTQGDRSSLNHRRKQGVFEMGSKMKKIYFTLFLLLTNCVSAPTPIDNKTYEKKFRASFDEVWRAAQQAVITYPLKVNNMEQGVIQTTLLRSHTYFKPPHLGKKHASGYRYDLSLNLLKETKDETTVSIHKNLQVYRDFISKPEDLTSDGLEEAMLLYRIEREIEIDRAIAKSAKEKSKTK